MNDFKTIPAPEWATYLGETNEKTGETWFTDLPTNCILNKGKTGCGGTETAINQNGHTIIAVPFVNLATNKEITNERRKYDVFAVHGKAETNDLIDYANSHETLKILVVYNSLTRLIDTLSSLGYSVYKDFFLLVDEYHILFNQYSFRNKAVKQLLTQAQNFERVTYMSATPIEKEFILEELKHLPTVIIKWPNTTEVTVQSRYQKKPLDYVVYLCRQLIEQNREGNLHFFVNSVKFISEVIEKAGLTPEQVKVVCADDVKNIRKLGLNYPIETPSTPVKKVNFYTSSAFEGCDVFDRQGRTYIVSDADRSQTLLDISTLFVQICGRIRDSIYKSDITHIFSTTRYSADLTLEEFTEKTDETLNKAVKHAEHTNQMPDDTRKWILSKIKYLNEKYVKIEDNRLIVDKNLANIDIVNFKITKQIYKTVITLSDELKRNGFAVNVRSVKFESPAEKVEMNPKARVSFQELFDEYADIKERPFKISSDNRHYKLSIIEDINSLVKVAYEKLGRAEVKRLKYNQTNIRREILKKLDISIENKIVESIDDCMTHYRYLPKSAVKEKLQKIYNDLGLIRKAKATDLDNWYMTKTDSRLVNGKNTACIMIVRSKFMRIE